MTSVLGVFMALIACHPREDITGYAAVEKFPEDSLLQGITSKRALIIIAHDDDMCGMAGTISKLNRDGWYIGVMSFSKTPERDSAQIEACRSILDTVMFIKVTTDELRNDLGSAKTPYAAIPKSAFTSVFNYSLITPIYETMINEFNPSVVLTLDNEMGGYGHPEHVFVSQLVVDMAASATIHPKYIYQSVYTNHMENTIMRRHAEQMKSWGFPGDDWDIAKQTYGVDGMPEPNVQVFIETEAQLKMDYLRSYNERERKVMGFYIPEFERYDPVEYFSVFNREFFRVIAVEAK
ncbi:MAG: PIG-L family deacetylase [Flavobacteriales bacterium]|nr:PIG-L family deacetylase [Flavobacteriales bacterium]